MQLTSNGLQILAAVLGTLGELSDGMQYGWTSPMVPRYQKIDAPFHINESQAQWIEILYQSSGLISIVLTVYLVDRIGRKNTILASSSCCVVAWFLIGIANHISYIYTARLITGLCADVIFISMPIYIAEIAHPNIRGCLTGLIQIMYNIGSILIYSIAPFAALYLTPLIGCGILITQISTFIFMPESPYYLMTADRKQEARIALEKLWNYAHRTVDDELERIASDIETNRLNRIKVQDIWQVKCNRRAIIIMTVLNTSLNMTGIVPIVMNMHSILSSADSKYYTTETSAVLIACVLLLGVFIGIALVDKLGRKFLLINSGILCGSSLFILGLYFHLQSMNFDMSNVSWLPLVCMILYGLSFRAGFGIVPIVITAEIFPAKIKAFGVGYADAVFITTSTLALVIYHQLGHNFGMQLPFYFYSIHTFLATLVIIFYIPETKGTTLEEIQHILER